MGSQLSPRPAGAVSATEYRFTSRWRVPASSTTTFDVLADVGAYPDWWPQVKAVARVDDDTARVVCRSVLPYQLDLVLTRSVEDRSHGVLEADIEGALTGWSRWTLEPDPDGTRLTYEQQVSISSVGLAAASQVLRPALVANHAWMMRGGRRGLLSHALARAGGNAR